MNKGTRGNKELRKPQKNNAETKRNEGGGHPRVPLRSHHRLNADIDDLRLLVPSPSDFEAVSGDYITKVQTQTPV